MISLKPILNNSKTKFAFAVTIIVLLSACSQTRKRIDEGETRIIPQSEYGSPESWREQYEPVQQYASKDTFRGRVKKGPAKSGKSVVSQR